MGFLVVLSIGSLLGWLAAILSRHDVAHRPATNIVLGAACALAGGLASGREPLASGISASGLMIVTLLTIAALAMFNLSPVGRARQPNG